MSESTYELFQRGRRHLRTGMPAQATVALEKAKRREPDEGVDPRGARDRLLPAPPLAGGRGRVPHAARALARPTTTPTTRSAARSRSRAARRRRTATTSSRARSVPGSRPVRAPGSSTSTSAACGRSSSGSARRACASTTRRAARSAPASASCSASRADATTRPPPRGSRGKIARLRVFADDDGRFDRSLLDTGGAALVVSQFTLHRRHARRATARASRGAAPPERGRAAVRALLRRAARARRPVATRRLRRERWQRRARQRRARDDRARAERRGPATARPGRAVAAILPAPHFTGWRNGRGAPISFSRRGR